MTKPAAKRKPKSEPLSPLARPDKPPTYFTFYSFKGGVGRSMALINCAAILAGRGFRVLAMDLDLEAPGISYFEADKDREQPGFIDILHDAIHLGEKAPFAHADHAKAIAHYIREIEVPQNLRTFDDGRLFVMPAGKLDGEYEKRRQQVNIPRLYESGRGRPLIQLLKKRLDECGLFDFVLLDSRTGFSDEAGICIRDLGEHLVMLLGLNRQNALGSARFLEQLRKSEIKPKTIDIVLSPVPIGEDELFNERRKDVAGLLRKALGKNPTLDLELPYHPRLALIETPHIFGRRHDFLYDAYHRLEARLRDQCGMSEWKLVTEGRKAIEDGKHSNALAAIEMLLRIDKALAASLLWQGAAQHDGRAEGEGYFKLLCDLQPNNAQVLGAYAIFLKNVIGAHGRAEEYYKRAIQATPDDADILASYAGLVAEIGENHDEAERLYDRAISLDPDSAGALGNYANFLRSVRKDHERAEQFYKRAIQADPQNATLLGNCASFLSDVRKDHERAEQFYKRAIHADPEHATNLGNYASFLKGIRKDYEHAEEFYKRAVHADPEHANNLGNYANFLKDVRKDHERAEQFYKRAIQADPEHANNLGNYAVFLTDVRKDHERAEQFYKRAIQADPEDANNLGNYAVFLTDVRKDYEGAEELYRQMLTLHTDEACHIANYSKMLFALGRMEEARSQFHAAWEQSEHDTVRLELCLYAYAHRVAPPPDQPLARLRALLLDGIRSPGWPLKANVERAAADGHPEPEFLAALAAVIADERPIEDLDAFPIWLNTTPFAE
jgi:tetratricopeptide (TPR) repeat protein